MNKRIETLLNRTLSKEYRQYRKTVDFNPAQACEGLSDTRRAALRLIRVLEMEAPVVFGDERIAILRTVSNIPEIFTPGEWEEIKCSHFIHGKGRVYNLTANYKELLELGLEGKKAKVLHAMKTHNSPEETEFLECLLAVIHAISKFALRYRDEALRTHNTEIAGIFEHISLKPPETFHQALQLFRLIHFCQWCAGNYHNTVGRFDQYMLPYLEADLRNGKLDMDTAFELLLEFFISFNKDSDLYPGVQQGDNGQSMVLGGVDQNGRDAYNILSEMCLRASLELKLIDPKINLRVNENTDLEIYKLGTMLTKQGLGFPQYSNDDIVIPGLTKQGYELADARDYSVAACWEYIIPGKGADIPNISALSFVKVVDTCVRRDLDQCNNFDSFMNRICEEIQSEAVRIAKSVENIYIEPSPMQSLLMDDCIKNAKDISRGGKYNNYGLHGTGVANATDSLAAIKKYVFEEKTMTPETLVQMLDNNFENDYDTWLKLRYETPKMGSNDDYADSIAVEILNMFADALSGLTNEKGGSYRAGAGTAMYYLRHVKQLGASPDGRKQGESLSANFSPSLHAKTPGPISILQSFSKPDMQRIINGGPLTIELSDSLFRSSESEEKVAMLVKSFMEMGGQQIQLNTLDKEKLLCAQKHPELYKNLIVRVWGWSGYFVELDREYQDHIINRAELAV